MTNESESPKKFKIYRRADIDPKVLLIVVEAIFTQVEANQVFLGRVKDENRIPWDSVKDNIDQIPEDVAIAANVIASLMREGYLPEYKQEVTNDNI